MIKTLIGLILLFIPFLLVSNFKDRKKGFFTILCFVIFFHLLIAVITQFFGIFNYWVVLSANLILCIGIMFKIDYSKLAENLKKIKVDWFLILLLVILIIELGSVHFNYTGKIVTFNGVEEISNMKYIYPYYSDEWSAVSFIQYSISSGNLPFANPLWKNSYFPNPEFAFHSFLSELFLILDLNPLLNYAFIALFVGILICLLIYLVLRINGINPWISLISALSLPYIVNSANLPGIWYLIPLSLGIVSFLLSLGFISFKDSKMGLFASFLTLIFYPPLFVLLSISLLCYFVFLEINLKDKIKYLGIYLGICIIAALLISLKLYFQSYSGFDAFDYILSKIFYFTFTRESIPDYSIWKVIPIWSLIFALYGLIISFKGKESEEKSWLIAPILIGLSYWLLYSFVFWRFIIEYQRVVFATSVLIVLFSGFGINYFFNFMEKKKLMNKNILNLIFIALIVIFLLFSFSYTQRDNWEELKLRSYGNKVGDPAPPANKYFSEEDLNLFKSISGKVFIAPAWKGLVIGTATGNYPLESKQSTITNSLLKYNEFINLNCDEKLKTSEKYDIDYVYSSEFECKGFELVGKSSEGLFLYKTKI